MTLLYKVCKICGEEDINKLKKNGRCLTGVQSLCNKCFYTIYLKDNVENKAYRKSYYKSHKEQIVDYRNKYYKTEEFRFRHNQREACRRGKINQTPQLTENEKKKIELYYFIAQQLGSDWHVDHIVPISKGGLHHPDNLQIVTKEYNWKKYNNVAFRQPTTLEHFKL